MYQMYQNQNHRHRIMHPVPILTHPPVPIITHPMPILTHPVMISKKQKII
jgi:hypothetical protein